MELIIYFFNLNAASDSDYIISKDTTVGEKWIGKDGA
jgi:hypothetical protein